MKKEFDSSETCYSDCQAKGFVRKTTITDTDKIQSAIDLSKEDLRALEKLDINEFPDVFLKLHYDALRRLIDILLLKERVRTTNHQCAFATLCHHHKELREQWSFLEALREKRNGINYDGKPVNKEEAKELCETTRLLITSLKKKLLL